MIFWEGILSKITTDISLDKLEGIFINQSPIGQVFNYGDLTIKTQDIYVSFTISNPNEFREIINKIKND